MLPIFLHHLNPLESVGVEGVVFAYLSNMRIENGSPTHSHILTRTDR